MKIKNPVLIPENVGRTDAGDPYIIREGGMYYYCYTAYNDLFISRFEHLSDIEKGEVKKIYDHKKQGNLGSWFAPEVHKIGERWYIYAAPGCKDDIGCHSMHILRSEAGDIFGEYEYLGNMKGLENTWAIDGTPFTYEDKLYMAVSWNGITLAELSDPFTLSEKRAIIATADREWERVMNPVIEGSCIIKRGKYIHMLYSASDCRSEHYCLGLLTFAGGDIMNPDNWKKSEKPLFSSKNGIFGPGHCSVTKNENGDDILVYHARLYGDSAILDEKKKNWGNRCVFYGKIEWNNDFPMLGEPQNEVEI
ncbi:MAG: hypothetical protein E7550_04725 [Ruminococcaceae bacterium]|nr:hypothetical protein [Oscillospiraceae bacterium]